MVRFVKQQNAKTKAEKELNVLSRQLAQSEVNVTLSELGRLSDTAPEGNLVDTPAVHLLVRARGGLEGSVNGTGRDGVDADTLLHELGGEGTGEGGDGCVVKGCVKAEGNIGRGGGKREGQQSVTRTTAKGSTRRRRVCTYIPWWRSSRPCRRSPCCRNERMGLRSPRDELREASESTKRNLLEEGAAERLSLSLSAQALVFVVRSLFDSTHFLHAPRE
jgi:hypothetical protein